MEERGVTVKALIRDKGETITENMDVDWIDWQTGHPLTSKAWCGGPYTLVENYVPPKCEDEPEIYDIIEPPAEEPEVEDEDEYVIIDGKRYSKEELRALL